MMKWSKIALAVVLPLVMGNSFALSGEELGQIDVTFRFIWATLYRPIWGGTSSASTWLWWWQFGL